MTPRKHFPVFIIGCHRSGTALIYDTLLSAGGFALYHSAPFVYSTLLPLCGNLTVPRNREKLMQVWLKSKPFRRSGLDAEDVRAKIRQECKSGGDFLRITMGEIARRGNVERWVSYDPDNIMYMATVKQEVPEALFVHIVRDGRDAALSLRKQHEVPIRWGGRKQSLFAAGLNWQWTVRKGRHDGRMFPADYIEVRYEDLVNHPEKTLHTLGEFLDHELDYRRIQKNGIGRVASPNTIWKDELNGVGFSPINRWKTKLSQPEVAVLETLIGECLEEFGYPLATVRRSSSRLDPRPGLMRILYPWYLETKLWLKSKTVLGRFVSKERLELAEPV